jgi:hypothetical protein
MELFISIFVGFGIKGASIRLLGEDSGLVTSLTELTCSGDYNATKSHRGYSNNHTLVKPH